MCKQVFDETTLGNMIMKNRLIRSATWEGLATAEGSFDMSVIQMYEALAVGGVGMIITGFTSVSEDDHYFGGMMRLSHDRHMAPMKELTDAIHAYGIPVVAQLALGAHFERLDNGRYKEIDISNLSIEQIKTIRQQFIAAAVRAEQAGFDGVQIHAAHNFFLSRFVNPVYNHRPDQYGLLATNRVRLIMEIMDGIREAAPNLTILIKLNANDFMPGGSSIEDVRILVKSFEEHGGHGIEISGNGTSVPSIQAKINEGYFLPYADLLRDYTSLPLIVVGGFRSMETITKTITNNRADYIAISRPLIREPELPNIWRHNENYIPKCISCNRCYHSEGHRCVFKMNR